MTRLQGSGRRALAAVAVLSLAASVAACHHDHDDDRAQDQPAPPVSGTPNPPTVTDAFIAYVTQVVATQDETSEPASIDGVAATAPDATEPVPLPGS